MEQDFEQSMRDKMDEASLNDLVPHFDKEGEWQELSERLHPNKRRSIIPMMWSHAAAIVVGVTIGWLLLKNTGKESAGVNEVARVINTTTTPAAPAVVHDTLLRVITTVKEVPATTRIAKTTPAPAPITIHDTIIVAANNDVRPPVTTDTMKAAPVAEAIAAVKRPRPRAVHLLDIDNEDKDLLISPDYHDLPKGALHTIQRIIFNQGAMVTSDDRTSNNAYPLRQVLKK